MISNVESKSYIATTSKCCSITEFSRAAHAVLHSLHARKYEKPQNKTKIFQQNLTIECMKEWNTLMELNALLATVCVFRIRLHMKARFAQEYVILAKPQIVNTLNQIARSLSQNELKYRITCGLRGTLINPHT